MMGQFLREYGYSCQLIEWRRLDATDYRNGEVARVKQVRIISFVIPVQMEIQRSHRVLIGPLAVLPQ